MGAGASFTLGPSWPPLHGRRAILRFGTTETPAALAQVHPARLDHPSPGCMGAGPSFSLGPRRPLPCWRGGLLHVWIIEALVAWARVPP